MNILLGSDERTCEIQILFKTFKASGRNGSALNVTQKISHNDLPWTHVNVIQDEDQDDGGQ